MRYFALACDYDGTIATLGQVDSETVAALQKVATSGRKLILVTGRILDELLDVFPEAVMFDRIVAENGAILYRPDSKHTKILGAVPPPEFLSALERENIHPLMVGQSIVATLQPNGAAVLKVIQQLGLQLQVIYNKESLMILPVGINKGTGLLVALDELKTSPQSTVAVGDAENDSALLGACGYGVAVANSVPALKAAADFVTSQANGCGVRQLADFLIQHDLQSLPARLASQGSTGRSESADY